MKQYRLLIIVTVVTINKNYREIVMIIFVRHLILKAWARASECIIRGPAISGPQSMDHSTTFIRGPALLGSQYMDHYTPFIRGPSI